LEKKHEACEEVVRVRQRSRSGTDTTGRMN